MPPALASLLCTGFVLYLLIREEKFESGVSRRIWLPTLWLLLSISRSLAHWLNAGSLISGETSYFEGSAVDRNVRLILMVLGGLALRDRSERVAAVLRNNRTLLLIFAFMALSLLWSDYAGLTLRRWVRAAGFVIMALIVLTEDTPWKAIDAMGRRLVYVAVPVSVLLIKYYPQLGVSFHRWQGYPMWVGITISKNDLGVLACYATLFMLRRLWAVPFAWRRFREKDFLIHLFLLLLCAHLLRGSDAAFSATSLLVCLCGVFVHAGLAIHRHAPARFLRLAGILAGVTLLLAVLAPALLIKLTTMTVGREETLTGRTAIWEAMYAEAMKRPILGTGYGAFYVGDVTYDWSSISGGAIGEGHNGYLDVFLELGIVGILLYAGQIASALRSTCRSVTGGQAAEGRLRLTLLTMVLLHNMAESGLFSGLPSLWFIWLLASMNRRVAPESPAPAPNSGVAPVGPPL